MVRAFAPGRVNLIGEHTDHTGGLVLPMAIDLGTAVTGTIGGQVIELHSPVDPEPAVVPIDVVDPAGVTPGWARYVAGVVTELCPTVGFSGSVGTTLPIGAGLSSSAALEVAVALALGFTGSAIELAQLCQRAEQRATGVPCGIMDQLASAAGIEGHALRIDCTTLSVQPVRLPDDIEVVVVDSGQRRDLTGTAYAERAAACQAAQAAIGPLREASAADVERLTDGVVRRRARHVVTENARVDQLVDALTTGDRTSMSDAFQASHTSLRDEFEVSTPVLDALVDRLTAAAGVIGARLTGAGFGGCVMALVDKGTRIPDDLTFWRVRPSAGARLLQGR
jgi:galactokinase